jgi:hypothetical protein
VIFTNEGNRLPIIPANHKNQLITAHYVFKLYFRQKLLADRAIIGNISMPSGRPALPTIWSGFQRYKI